MIRHRIAPRLYRLVLWLYPASFRSEFGPEMEETFREALERAVPRGIRSRLRLTLREVAGLMSGAARERTTPEALAAAARSSLAPLAAGLAVSGVFFLGILFAGGAYVFQPLLNAFLLAVLVLGSIEAGRLQAEAGPWGRRLLRTGLALVIVLAAVPAARLADHLWLDELARSGGEVDYSLPGIDVRAVPVKIGTGSAAPSVPWDEILPADRRGLIHSGSHAGTSGTQLVTVWHRQPSSPPYEILLPLLAGTMAVAAGATRRRMAPGLQA